MAWYIYPVICCSILAQFVGHFGNFNLIILHYRLPKLRTNYGYLLTFLTISQTFCLIFDNVSLYFAIYGQILNHPIYRDKCFHAIFIYLFFNSFQQEIVTMISVDLLICLLFPIKYRNLYQPYYLPILLLLPTFHGLYLTILGYLTLDSSEIELCNPPATVSLSLSLTNYFITLCTCSITILAYFISYLIIYLKNRKKSRVEVESKTLKSLSVIVIVFIITRLIGIIAVNLQWILDFSPETIKATVNCLTLSALVGFSQNFYVCYFRSKEYRQMMNQQLLPVIRFFRPNYELRRVFVGDGMSKSSKVVNKK